MSLQFDRIEKSFGAINALRGVTFSVEEGEAHALVGENGAGKSTLLKILAGLVRADAGEIRWQGRRFAPAGPRDAIAHGIGMVYQEMLCFPNLSVSANIFSGREITHYGVLDEAAMHARTSAVLARLSLTIDPGAIADSLSAAHRQLLQVARAIGFECKVLVLDEPTTALTDAEADHLFAVLRELKQSGTTILYVSHRLPEVFRLCDRITVLRDGAYVDTYPRAEVSSNDIVRAMVGRELPQREARLVRRSPEGEGGSAKADGLKVSALSRPPHFHSVNLTVARGEIVGLFGLVGSGRSELLETIFGLHRPSAGAVLLDNVPAWFHSPRDAARAGIALVPEERHRQGLLFNLPVRDNLVIPRCALSDQMLIQDDEERREADRLLGAWRIKAAGIDALPESLSGGNQQKVVVAKWLATGPRVLLLDEPTKGVDVGAKFEIHEMIRRQAAAGLAVLMVSSDLPEVLAVADRIVVMKQGRIQGVIAGDDATEEAVMHLATHDAPFDSAQGKVPA